MTAHPAPDPRVLDVLIAAERLAAQLEVLVEDVARQHSIALPEANPA